ncbi:MAG: hypothetical protein K0R72_894 [Clostridia bacterium]|jgi:regulatory protein|nr:hypothetical protein [Clostridia bacterium]
MEFEEAKFKAIKYLGISKKTEYEVEMKLKRLNIDEKIINKVIQYLIEINYINDLDYVESFIRQNEKMLKYSIYEISEKLKVKGVNSDLIEDRLNNLSFKNYENSVIEKIINSKSKNMDIEKINQYLFRRGFKKR